jgi:5-methyltetrahydrofolate--homocysteine methyltransferase
MSESLDQLTAAIKAGKRKEAQAATQAALTENLDPQSILSALTAGMDDVGRRFKANEIFVPEVLVAARAMKTSMELLEPVLVASGIKPEHTVVIGTVEGDLHDIGKNLVAMMLKGANFAVVDLGTNVGAGAFVEAVRSHNAKLVGLSALLTTTMPSMKTAVAALREAGLDAKVMIGGAPITDEFAKEIGADGYSPDAASAVDLARTLLAA